MGLFDHEARQFKFDVLREVALASFQGEVSPTMDDDLAYKLIPTLKANFRCCVYKEREIIRARTRMALGRLPNSRKDEITHERQFVHVIESACDGCTIKRIHITDNCRKCMAKSCKVACKFDAIEFSSNRAHIIQDKCKECGACVKACAFNAVVETIRPCKASCAVNAISMDEFGIAKIDMEKCINCAACQSACPFGAIEDISHMSDVIGQLRSDQKVIAMVAPSIQGQLDSATLPQIKEGIRQLGFDMVVEVAAAADIVAYYEKEELKEKIALNQPMTSSCCPAFVNMIKMHYPELKPYVSTMKSPMMVMGQLMKARYPDALTVFIGPCVAKKQEAYEDDHASVDYVLTFEEIAAMLVSQRIYCSGIEVDQSIEASKYGREFARVGGVSAALVAAMKEDNQPAFRSSVGNGCGDCKKALMMLKVKRHDFDVLEGMACVGGCANGPGVIETNGKVKQRFDKENMGNTHKISDTLKAFEEELEHIHIHTQH